MWSWTILSQSSSSNVCMHDVPEEEEALPQRWHVLPWEPLQQWYISHFLIFLHKISILTASISLSAPRNSIFFLGNCSSFAKQRKIHFLLHSTPFSLIIFLCLRLPDFLSYFGVGKPKNAAAADWYHSTAFNVVWFTGRLHRTHIFKEAKKIEWILDLLSLGGVVTILSAFPYSPLEPGETCLQGSLQVLRPESQSDSETVWQWVKQNCREVRCWGSGTEVRLELSSAEAKTQHFPGPGPGLCVSLGCFSSCSNLWLIVFSLQVFAYR